MSSLAGDSPLLLSRARTQRSRKVTAWFTTLSGVTSTLHPAVASSLKGCGGTVIEKYPQPNIENTPTTGLPMISGPVPREPPECFSAPFAASMERGDGKLHIGNRLGARDSRRDQQSRQHAKHQLHHIPPEGSKGTASTTRVGGGASEGVVTARRSPARYPPRERQKQHRGGCGSPPWAAATRESPP